MTLTQQVDALYAAYPKKVAPRAAKRAIGAALKRASYDVILAGVERYAQQAKRWKRSKEWHPAIAYPATWFNGDRWGDEVTEVKEEECLVFYTPGVDLEWSWKTYEPRWRKCGCDKCLDKIERWVGYDPYAR